MLTYVRTSLFESPAQTLVNTVNLVGVMGKGVAKEFRDRYPSMFRAYKKLCDQDQLSIGKLHLWRGDDRWIINFPTKTTWRKPSKIEYIEAGLETFVRSYARMGISSISFPPLGCGNGNLDWSKVRPIMEQFLRNLEIPVYVHDVQVGRQFVPEHLEDSLPVPSNFDQFVAHLRRIVERRGGEFCTLRDQSCFNADFHNMDIVVSTHGKRSVIEGEHLVNAWSTLQNGFLTYEQFSGSEDRKSKSYLFAILATLPYMKTAELQKVDWGKPTVAHALFFKQPPRGRIADLGSASERLDQLCLWDESGR